MRAPAAVTLLVRFIPAFAVSPILPPEVMSPPVIPLVDEAVAIETGFPLARIVPLTALTLMLTAPAPPLKVTVLVAVMSPVDDDAVVIEPAVEVFRLTLFAVKTEPAPSVRLRLLPAPLL